MSVVGLAVGPHGGMQVWTGTPSSLSGARVVAGASARALSPAGRPVRGGGARTRTQVPTGSRLGGSPTGTRIAFIAVDAIVQLPVVGKGPIRRISLPTSWARSVFAALAWSSANGLAFSRTYGNG